jgi:hypothetical protein
MNATARPEAIDKDALKSIIGAVYPTMLAEPATVRTRAQSAYAIASAIATALITAGVLADIAEFSLWVQVLGTAAVATWMFTAAMFINISRRVTKIPRVEGDQLLTETEFVSQALNLAVTEAEALESQLSQAAKATHSALALTALALFLAAFMPIESQNPVSSVQLTAAGTALVKQACPGATERISGELKVATLADDYAELVTEECGDEAVTLRIPPKYIASVTTPETQTPKPN